MDQSPPYKKRKYTHVGYDDPIYCKKKILHYEDKDEVIKNLLSKNQEQEKKLKLLSNQVATLKYKLEYNTIPDYIS
jgi:hypothetical protein